MDPNQQISQPLEKMPISPEPKGLPKVAIVGIGVFVCLVVVGMFLYIILPKPTETQKESSTVTKTSIISAVELTSEYSNPFDGTTDAKNPFAATESTTENPFDALTQ